MPINPDLNAVLKQMWLLDEKITNQEKLDVEEEEFYTKNLPTIKNYYHEQFLYWKDK